jgi:nucleoid-associated protein YgaU
LTIGKGVTAGHYVVRADAIDDKGKVTARAEVPFDVPVAVAQAAAPPKPAASAEAKIASNAMPTPDQDANPAQDASHAVVPEIDTATVTRGDSLWRISQKELGEGIRYTLIYQANASQIRDPNLIYPGQVFVMPHTN